MGCYDEDDPGLSAAAAAAAGTDDISRLVSCCPGLHRINIEVQPGAQLSDLAKATGLTHLSVSGLREETFESLRALSGLVSLQELSVHLGGPIAPQDLLCLTTLTGLTRLLVDPSQLPEFEGAGDVELQLRQVCTIVRVTADQTGYMIDLQCCFCLTQRFPRRASCN